ncbi:MAG: hydrogenase expression/formation protein HypE [Campylobacter sp.]|nr:hydrogenase expression/formation protein HypE [Campylobacter sp.]
MKEDRVLLSHGGGGEEMSELIDNMIFKAFDSEILEQRNDAAILENLAFTTDSYVVTPLFFSGGDIGKIAACGTINDLAMVGAMAKYLSCSLIIEEGFLISYLKIILNSMAQVCRENCVKIVCGDTKVVPKGKCDGLFINTSGIGEIYKSPIKTENLEVGAKVLLSGDIARHGSVIMAARDEINMSSNLKSDSKSLKPVVKALLDEGVIPLAMRDATRGGVSAVLNEWASFNGVEILVKERDIKISNEVAGICELLGFEPYDLANEGTFVLAVKPQDEEKACEILKSFDSNAGQIGEITNRLKGRVILENIYGVTRFLEPPKGELLPRIC